MTYYYTVDNEDYMYDYIPPKWRTQTYDLTDEWDIEALAEECADDWFSNHDGWERRSWSEGTPVQFNICSDKGEVIASFDVSCEYEPRFSACRKE